MLQLASRLKNNEVALNGITSLFESSDFVSREEFNISVQPLLKRHTFIHAFDWAPRVLSSEREAFEVEAQKEGLTGYQIKESGDNGSWVRAAQREEYFPILFREPAEGGKQFLGYDQLSSLQAKEIIDKSRNTGEMLATKKFILSQAREKQPVVLVFVPAYRKKSDPTNVEDENKYLIGYLFGVYHIEKMIDAGFVPFLSKEMSITVYQEKEGSENLIYGDLGLNTPLRIEATLDFFGQPWLIVWHGSHEFLGGFNKASAFLGSGILISVSIFLAIIFQMNITRREQVEIEVVKRTEELSRAYENLERENVLRVQAEKDLIKARDEAETASRVKGQFISAMSHELRTPMNAILGFSQILDKNKELSGSGKNALKSIHQAAKHLMDLINDILDFSQVSDGIIELNRIDFDLIGLVKDLSNNFEKKCQNQNLKWEVQGIEEKEHIFVHGDRGKLRQVLTQLLSNSLKFTTSGGIVLTINELTNDQFQFEVIDTGQGIPLEQHGTIFESFYQEEKGFKKGGLGLGLSMSKKQVELMGGELELKSAQNEGSRFFFTLILTPAKNEISVLNEYELESTPEEFEETENELDFSKIIIPQKLFNELKEAVQLGDLMGLDPYISELEKIEPTGKELAEYLSDLADKFDDQKILDVLDSIEKT